MNKLHPNVRILFYLTGVITLLFITGIFLIPLSAGFLSEGIFVPEAVFVIFFFWMIVCFLPPLPFAYLKYENYGYVLETDRIVIERGIIWKRHVSIPYERVQNVDIIRGPLARMLELSDLQIQTAGASTQMMVEGRIPGIAVEEAKKLKDEILAKVTKSKNQGL